MKRRCAMMDGVVSAHFQPGDVDGPTAQAMLPSVLPEQFGLRGGHRLLWIDSWNFAVNQNYGILKKSALEASFMAQEEAFHIISNGIQ